MTEWTNFISELLQTEKMEQYRSMIWIMLGTSAISCLIMLALYILRAVSVYTMAKSADIAAPWMAFIPILNIYTFGVIAEKFVKEDHARRTKFGGLLLSLNLIKRILSAMAIFILVLRIEDFFKNPQTIGGSDFVKKLIPILFLCFLSAGIAIVETVLHYIALYRVFQIFHYQNAGTYTALSVLGMLFVSDILEPVLLFVVRKKTPVFDYRERLEQSAENEQMP